MGCKYDVKCPICTPIYIRTMRRMNFVHLNSDRYICSEKFSMDKISMKIAFDCTMLTKIERSLYVTPSPP